MTPHRQSGMSLVSLLVGLLLSLVVLLAMTGTYRGVVRSVFGNAPGDGTGLVTNARLDGQLSSGLLSAQLALQDAGYGIPGAAADSELIVLTGAALSGSSAGKLSGTPAAIAAGGTAGNAIVWTSNPQLLADPAQHRCQALLWTPKAGAASGQLQLLTADAGCRPLAASWSGVNWSAQTLVAEDVGASTITLSASSGADCWPFGAVPKAISGLQPPAAKLSATLGWRYSTAGGGGGATTNSMSVCLTNFQS